MTRACLILLTSLALAGPVPSGDAPNDAEGSFYRAVAERRLNDAIQSFGQIARKTPRDDYLAGWVRLELHEPEDAAPLLRRAAESGFPGPDGWPRTDDLLARVRTVELTSPPPAPRWSPGPAIRVYAGPPTDWSAPVLRALPEFQAVGRRIFGNDVPTLKLYLFAARRDYETWYPGMFGRPLPGGGHDGTGNVHVAVYCERDERGMISRPAGQPETIGNVLHELGHAWWGTYFMDRHNKQWLSARYRRPWLDEGLSDYAAFVREPNYLERRRAWLADEKVARGVPPPTYDELAGEKQFYAKGSESRYWVSALLVHDLLGPPQRGAALIPEVLDRFARSGNAEQAFRDATGKDPRREFERLVNELWSPPPKPQ